MSVDRINILLILLKTNKTRLADEIGERREIVTMVVNGQRKSARIQDKIVRYLRKQITAKTLFEPAPIGILQYDASGEEPANLLPADWVPSESIERSA